MSVESEIIWLRLLLQLHREQAAAQPQDFDTWMHARTDAAHAAFMKRTSAHLPCDWRFTPEQIADYLGIEMEEITE